MIVIYRPILPSKHKPVYSASPHHRKWSYAPEPKLKPKPERYEESWKYD